MLLFQSCMILWYCTKNPYQINLKCSSFVWDTYWPNLVTIALLGCVDVKTQHSLTLAFSNSLMELVIFWQLFHIRKTTFYLNRHPGKMYDRKNTTKKICSCKTFCVSSKRNRKSDTLQTVYLLKRLGELCMQYLTKMILSVLAKLIPDDSALERPLSLHRWCTNDPC